MLSGCASNQPSQPVAQAPVAALPPLPMDSIAATSKSEPLAILEPPPTNSVPTNSVTLAWNASTSPLVAGYRIYYGTASGSYTNGMIDVGNVTQATLSLLWPCTVARYYFVSTAYAFVSGTTNIVESPNSNEAHFPPYPPILTGYHLSGSGSVASSSDLSHWQAFTNVDTNGIDLPTGLAIQFFRGTNLNLKPNLFYPQ